VVNQQEFWKNSKKRGQTLKKWPEGSAEAAPINESKGILK